MIKALGVQRVMYRDEGDEVVRRYTHEKVTELKVGPGAGKDAEAVWVCCRLSLQSCGRRKAYSHARLLRRSW